MEIYNMKHFVISVHDSFLMDTLRKQLKNLNIKKIVGVYRYELKIGDEVIMIYSSSPLSTLGTGIKKLGKNEPQLLMESNVGEKDERF